MQNMLVLLNNLDAESRIPQLVEIASVHGMPKAYLARLSADFGSRVRSIVAPHKLEMAARMGDGATDKYLSVIASALRKAGLDCETVSGGIAPAALDDFIKKNSIGLVLTSDGRSGICTWLPSGGLFGRHIEVLEDHAFAGEKTPPPEDGGSSPGPRKMLVLLERPDIEDRLPQLRDIVLSREVKQVHIAAVSPAHATAPISLQGLPIGERLVVYLARVSRAFGRRVRSRVAPDKLDMAARMGNRAAGRYLATVVRALSAQGVEAVPIGTGIPAEKVREYVSRNGIELLVSADGGSGLRCWDLATADAQSLLAAYPQPGERGITRARTVAPAISGTVFQFSALLAFWLVLSGRYQLKYVLLGAASAALVTILTKDSLSAVFRHVGAGSLMATVVQSVRFLRYLPWLFWQVVKANIQVARIVLDPRLPVEPVLLQFHTQMRRELAQVTLATSITLTPGTVTVSLDNGRYTIHALVRESAEDLARAGMQNKVAEIFAEKKERPPQALWANSIGELAR